MNKQQFREEVKELKKQGITQKQIAEKLGFSVKSIERAMSFKFKGSSKRVYQLFELKYNKFKK